MTNQISVIQLVKLKTIQKKSSQNIKSPISPICSNQNLDYVINALKNNRKKTENKITKPQNLKLIKDNYLFSVEYVVHKNLHKKYNYTQKKYNLLCINYLQNFKNSFIIRLFSFTQRCFFFKVFVYIRFSFFIFFSLTFIYNFLCF